MNISRRMKAKLIEDYWVNKLKGRKELPLPAADFCSTPAVRLSARETAYLHRITGGEPLALMTVLLSVYSLVAARCFSHHEGIICSAATPEPPMRGSVRPLVFFVPVQEQRTLKEMIGIVRNEVAGVMSHRSYDLQSVTERTGIARLESLSDFGLFFNGANGGRKNAFQWHVRYEDGCLENWISFAEDFTGLANANSILKHLNSCLANLQEYASMELARIPVGPREDEVEEEEEEEEETYLPAAQALTPIGRFCEQVRKTPATTALEYGNARLTYADLNLAANQLAHYLINECGVEARDVVGLLLPRSGSAVIAMLAVMKTGAAFQFIDTEKPFGQAAGMMNENAMKVLLHKGAPLPESAGSNFVDLENLSLSKQQVTDPDLPSTPEDPCLMIGDAGAPGKAKNVVVRQAAVLASAMEQARVHGLGRGDRVVWFAPIASGASVNEMLTTILSGGVLLVPKQEDLATPEDFQFFLVEKRATLLAVTPEDLHVVASGELPELRCVITSYDEDTKAIDIPEEQDVDNAAAAGNAGKEPVHPEQDEAADVLPLPWGLSVIAVCLCLLGEHVPNGEAQTKEELPNVNSPVVSQNEIEKQSGGEVKYLVVRNGNNEEGGIGNGMSFQRRQSLRHRSANWITAWGGWKETLRRKLAAFGCWFMSVGL
jgi:hypothetical protein